MKVLLLVLLVIVPGTTHAQARTAAGTLVTTTSCASSFVIRVGGSRHLVASRGCCFPADYAAPGTTVHLSRFGTDCLAQIMGGNQAGESCSIYCSSLEEIIPEEKATSPELPLCPAPPDPPPCPEPEQVVEQTICQDITTRQWLEALYYRGKMPPDDMAVVLDALGTAVSDSGSLDQEVLTSEFGVRAAKTILNLRRQQLADEEAVDAAAFLAGAVERAEEAQQQAESTAKKMADLELSARNKLAAVLTGKIERQQRLSRASQRISVIEGQLQQAQGALAKERATAQTLALDAERNRKLWAALVVTTGLALGAACAVSQLAPEAPQPDDWVAKAAGGAAGTLVLTGVVLW